MPVSEHTRLAFKNAVKKGYFSVIVPVYKDAEGLRDTLESLSKQTLDHTRFDVIVGNDGSDSRCSDVCRAYHFVREVTTQTNVGAYVIRNKAIEESRGEFVAFTDADIRVPPEWLEQLLQYFSHGADYIGGDVVIDPDKILTLTNRLVAQYEFQNRDMFKMRHFSPTANVAVRRSVLELHGGFDRRFYSTGDYEFGDRIYRSGSLQTFAENIAVIHPPRDYSAFMKKLARISGGEADLLKYYPERFATKQPKSAYQEFRDALHVPRLTNYKGTVDKLKLIALTIWFQLWRAWNNVLNSRIAGRKRSKQ